MSPLFRFKLWLESQDYYDKNYHNKFDQLGFLNPQVFSHWFPENQDRVYLPFIVNGDDATIKATEDMTVAQLRNTINNLLKKHNYILADFKKGLAAPVNMPKRQQRIVPVLQSIPGVENIKREYEKALLRLNPGENNFNIVISQNPHDIALMSYDRHWKMASCMRLHDDKVKGGEKAHQVEDEVMSGGIIAYLIDPEDRNIKKPYSRVLIRRFSGKKEIAVCEETVYGLVIPGFLEAVKKWVASKQKTTFGLFSRRGAEWSDTFPPKYLKLPKYQDYTKENQSKLLEMLDELEPESMFAQIQAMVAEYKKFDKEFVEKIIEKANEEFKRNPKNSFEFAITRAYIYHIPNIARELGIPVDKVTDILMAYPLDMVTTIPKGKDEFIEYIMPALIEMAKNINKNDENYYNLADNLNAHPIFNNKEFINNMPDSAIEELAGLVRNPEIKDLMINRLIENMKKEIPEILKDNQGQQALDIIGDSWITPLLDIIPPNKINYFYEQLREVLPKELFNQLAPQRY